MSMLAYLAMIDASVAATFRREADSILRFIENDQLLPPARLELHKMWQGLHFILTGTAWNNSGPLGQAILGGDDVGPNLGYGPARLRAPEQVRATSEALSTIAVADFRRRFDPSAMDAAGVYPGIWMRERDTILDELVPLFENLRAFYRNTATRHYGALLWMR
jgi:hypothetical protein